MSLVFAELLAESERQKQAVQSQLKPDRPLEKMVSQPNRTPPSPNVIGANDKTERKSERTEDRTEIRSEKRTVFPLPIKRRTRRYSFEFYEDQLIKLKQLKYRAEMAGGRLTLSDLAREALDLYLNDKEL